ncbi:MAG TPA: RpiB/LacA/LacB family sugar-phosphate isomerase [Geobacterales bacterium]|nr:RpiB/LacA/LacB family sugar-phosphate isomerase [Geobacterales bacterium]
MKKDKISIGSDDLYPVAVFLKEELLRRGYDVLLHGSLITGKVEPWPDVAKDVAKDVLSGEAKTGIVICYTGTGVSIAANKIKGIRAALCYDAETARGARLWNDANVLALSGRLTSNQVAKEIIDAWLSTDKIDESERANIEKLKLMETL